MIKSVRELSQLWNCEVQLTEGLETNKLIQSSLHFFTIKDAIYNMPVVKSNGLKSAAGKAIFSNKLIIGPHIRLHPALYDDNDEVVLQRLETFFHEIAHHIAYKTNRDHGHGYYWAYCLMHFGFAPERCYNGVMHNFRGYKKRNENREVDAIVADLPEFDL